MSAQVNLEEAKKSLVEGAESPPLVEAKVSDHRSKMVSVMLSLSGLDGAWNWSGKGEIFSANGVLSAEIKVGVGRGDRRLVPLYEVKNMRVLITKQDSHSDFRIRPSQGQFTKDRNMNDLIDGILSGVIDENQRDLGIRSLGK